MLAHHWIGIVPGFYQRRHIVLVSNVSEHDGSTSRESAPLRMPPC